MRVLVISVHPDDETLGCGGSLLRHRDGGDALHWAIMTQGHEPHWTAETIKAKHDEVDGVAAAYGMESVDRLGFPSGSLDTVPTAELIESLRPVVEQARPQTVYLVHPADVHSDHRAAFDAAASLLKPFHMGRLGVRRILSFETLSSTEAAATPSFVPTVFVDVSDFLERKLEIMSLYATEIHSEPLPRSPSSIRALARYRGATVGVEYAEAFALVRELIPGRSS